MRIGKKKIREYTRFLLFNIVGSGLYALGVQFFTAPNNIAPGGVTGIATIIHSVWGLPIGTMTMVINLPLLYLSWKYIGKTFTVRTAVSTLILSVLTDALVLVVGRIIPAYVSDSPVGPLMAALYGGALMGIGNAMVYMVGSTTGGTAIVGALLQKAFRHLSFGNLLMASNLMVVVASMLVYKNIDTGLLAFICIFTSSIVMDKLVYGLNVNRLLFIISGKSREIEGRIMNEMRRGVTILKGEGAYKHSQTDVIFCVVSRAQFFKVREIAMSEDERAFIVGCEAGDVLGKGFKHID